MRKNVHVCVSVCLCVCVSVCARACVFEAWHAVRNRIMCYDVVRGLCSGLSVVCDRWCVTRSVFASCGVLCVVRVCGEGKHITELRLWSYLMRLLRRSDVPRNVAVARLKMTFKDTWGNSDDPYDPEAPIPLMDLPMPSEDGSCRQAR